MHPTSDQRRGAHPERRGPAPNYLAHVKGEPATKDLFDGVGLSWRRFGGGEVIDRLRAHGLRLREPVRRGTWSGRAHGLSFQDIVVADR